MSSSVKRLFRAAIYAIPMLAVICSSAQAQEGPSVQVQEGDDLAARGFYAAIFGGGGGSSNVNATQTGYALYEPGYADGRTFIRPMQGNTSSSNGTGLVGMQVGEEWSVRPIAGSRPGLATCCRVRSFLSPGHPRRKSDQSHHSDRGTRLHRYIPDGFWGIYSQRGYQSPDLPSPSPLHWGRRRHRVRRYQTSQFRTNRTVWSRHQPFESGPDSSRWTFASQAKTGIRINLTDRIWVFGEYRFFMSKPPITRLARRCIPRTPPPPTGTCMSAASIAISRWEALVLVSSVSARKICTTGWPA